MTSATIKRIFRHLLLWPAAVKRYFPRSSLRRIEAAIAEAELKHMGEICFVVEQTLPLADLLRKKSARARAIEVFAKLRVWDTEHNNGVLIYLLLADRDFEIVADRGVHMQVGAVGWQHICHEMEAQFRQGQFEAGVVHGVARIAEHLVQHYPATNQHNINELANAPIII